MTGACAPVGVQLYVLINPQGLDVKNSLHTPGSITIQVRWEVVHEKVWNYGVPCCVHDGVSVNIWTGDLAVEDAWSFQVDGKPCLVEYCTHRIFDLIMLPMTVISYYCGVRDAVAVLAKVF